jgi:hypothetical protein
MHGDYDGFECRALLSTRTRTGARLRLTNLMARLPNDALKRCADGDCRESTNGVSNHLERRILTGYLGYANMSQYSNVSPIGGSVMRFVLACALRRLREP